MSSAGWIKLHRQLQECPMWYEERFSKGQAWVDLLLLANHSDKKILFNGDFIIIKRGQYLTSMVRLAEKWKWDRKTVAKYLKLLEKDKMITLDVDNHKTLITIDNYKVYQQSEDDTLDNDMDNRVDNPMDNSMVSGMDTNKNDKELIKNEREYTHAHEEVDFDDIWQKTFAAYPKKSNHASAKVEWMNRLAPVVEPNRKAVATLIWQAMKLYLKDYSENNPDDTAYRFVPTFNKWLTEDLDYWLAEVERRNHDRN